MAVDIFVERLSATPFRLADNLCDHNKLSWLIGSTAISIDCVIDHLNLYGCRYST